ncbi:MarR family winged helix-turn-helix transcriptional regulator [Jiangella anatolica]|uniref:MarR family transcriptional regulator n=1 Tax=Jiangella anatolica TaxID=2670374 RepID=A0A2W2BUI6_9ACTN|nr:MarR family transcriptional regulator [Jiangella anatolica]PZF79779.1 MarR family transcriptional regulator [Jiangella anatolica]
MSTQRPVTGGRERPVNVVVLLREAFTALNDRALRALAERGHGDVRAAHGAIFQHLDDTGTTVSRLAERAQITKQAAAELVQYLEAHGYVVREPDPSDRRAKLVLPTAKGREVVAIAQSVVPEIHALLARDLGVARLAQLRADLRRIIDLA